MEEELTAQEEALPGEGKADKFKRIAAGRVKRILNDIRLLGNCANTSNYEYSPEDVNKIFTTLERELKRVNALFQKKKVEDFGW